MNELYKGAGSIPILVIGKSGRGKTTAMRTLPPDRTFLINVIGKPLPFLGGAAKYKVGTNMHVGTEAGTAQATMLRVSKDESFDYLVIDDVQYIMAGELMQKAAIKGYDKYTMMAKNFWDLLLLASKLRDGLKVFILAHEEDTGDSRKIKLYGKMLEEKLNVEGMSAITLFADAQTKENTRSYFFTTQTDGITTAKTPMGLFPYTIPNDLKLVADRIDEYYTGVELRESKLDLSAQERGRMEHT